MEQDGPSRPEAIRRLVELALAGMQATKQRSPKARSKASDLAGEQIDKLSDPSATEEERQQRKRRLLKGPRESGIFEPHQVQNEALKHSGTPAGRYASDALS